jgi:hypothetical protein
MRCIGNGNVREIEGAWQAWFVAFTRRCFIVLGEGTEYELAAVYQ